MVYRLIFIVLFAFVSLYPASAKFRFAVPALNWIYHSSIAEKSSAIGAWLVGAGYELHSKHGFYLLAGGEMVTTTLLPFGPLEAFDKNEQAEIAFALQGCREMGRFSFGIGPQYGKLYHLKKGHDEFHDGYYVCSTSKILGLRLTGEARLTDHISAGLGYSPYFYDFKDNGAVYSHVLSLSFILKTDKI